MGNRCKSIINTDDYYLSTERLAFHLAAPIANFLAFTYITGALQSLDVIKTTATSFDAAVANNHAYRHGKHNQNENAKCNKK